MSGNDGIDLVPRFVFDVLVKYLTHPSFRKLAVLPDLGSKLCDRGRADDREQFRNELSLGRITFLVNWLCESLDEPRFERFG